MLSAGGCDEERWRERKGGRLWHNVQGLRKRDVGLVRGWNTLRGGNRGETKEGVVNVMKKKGLSATVHISRLIYFQEEDKCTSTEKSFRYWKTLEVHHLIADDIKYLQEYQGISELYKIMKTYRYKKPDSTPRTYMFQVIIYRRGPGRKERRRDWKFIWVISKCWQRWRRWWCGWGWWWWWWYKCKRWLLIADGPVRLNDDCGGTNTVL